MYIACAIVGNWTQPGVYVLVCSREDSLDVEIAASGFTKEMDESLIEVCIIVS